MPFFTALPLIAAAATAQPSDENRTLFNAAMVTCTALVLNEQRNTEDELRIMERQAADRYGFSLDAWGAYGIRLNGKGHSTLGFNYRKETCTVHVSADLYAPDVPVLIDYAGRHLKTTFAHPSRDVWTSPVLTVTYDEPAADDPDRIARLTFKRGG
jgi:hypothetical protein